MSLPQGFCAAALCLALGAAGQASAQGQPFAVVPTAQPAAPALTAVVNLGVVPAAGTVPEFAQKAAAAVAAAVAKSGAKQLRPEDLLAMASAGDMPIDARDELKQALEAATAGRKLYQSMDYDQAVPHLQNARALMLKHFLHLDTIEPMTNTLLSLAMIEIARGNDAKATQAIEELVRLSPTFKPDPAIIPPQVIAQFEGVRAKILAGPRAHNTIIRTDPPGADLSFDGRPLGQTPIRLRGMLVTGLYGNAHILKLSKPGFRTTREPITLPAGGDLERHFALAPDPILAQLDAARGGLGTLQPRDQTIAALAGLATASAHEAALAGALHHVAQGYILAVALVPAFDPGGTRVAVGLLPHNLSGIEMAAGVLLREVTGPAARVYLAPDVTPAVLEGIEFERTLVGYRPAPGESLPEWYLAPLAGAEPPPEPDDGRPFYKKWWFYGAVGLVVAGGATAAILMTTGGDEAAPPAQQGTPVVVIQGTLP